MRLWLLASSLALLASCTPPPVNRTGGPPLTVVPSVDVERYLGRWYEIARLENRFEEGCEGVTAEYSRRSDGLIQVANTCRDASGKAKIATGRAKVVDTASNAKLKVSFFGPFWGDYWILDLAPDYSRSIVGEPSGRYLWILARTPTISDESRKEALALLEAKGYRTAALHFTRHKPAGETQP